MATQLTQLKTNSKGLTEMILKLEKTIVEINESSIETINEIRRRLGTLEYNREQLKEIEGKLDVMKTNLDDVKYQLGLYETMKRSSRFLCFKSKPLIK